MVADVLGGLVVGVALDGSPEENGMQYSKRYFIYTVFTMQASFPPSILYSYMIYSYMLQV